MTRDKMSRVVLEGGLGNQLFGVAFALELAKARRHRVTVDTHRLSARPLVVDRLETLTELLQESGITFEKGPTIGRYRARLARDIARERSQAFDSEVLTAPRGSTFLGYFQSARYFSGVAQEIRCAVRQDLSIIPTALSRIHASHIMHVRRGDYVASADFHGLCTSAYFRFAAHLLSQGAKWVVVTDADKGSVDVAEFGATRALHPDDLDDPLVVLKVISSATSLVLSNSTLSWWGAFLSDCMPGHVVAPRPWFEKLGHVADGIALPEWISLDRRIEDWPIRQPPNQSGKP